MLNVTQSSMPSFEEYCNEIKELWDSHWLTNMGIKHRTFQAQLEKFLNCKNVVLYTNGHLALENIISAMNFPKDSEIITTPFTFASTTHAIVRNQLKPIFCDINPYDFTIDVTKIEKLISDKTVAILPVHVYGNICNIEEIDKIARKYNLKVIYDAAHSFAETYKGINVSNFGDASMFSFHATKVFNTIEGGCICTENNNLVTILNDLKNFGIHGQESVQYVGGNAKMNEFQAAMGICNLRHLSSEIEKRKHVADLYNKALGNIKGIRIQAKQRDVESNYAYYPIVFENYKYSRNQVFDMLKENGIMARKYFYPLTNNFECYKEFDSSKTPVAKKIADNVLCLPMFSDLSEENINKIVSVVLR